jgi:hypothetical protein
LFKGIKTVLPFAFFFGRNINFSTKAINNPGMQASHCHLKCIEISGISREMNFSRNTALFISLWLPNVKFSFSAVNCLEVSNCATFPLSSLENRRTLFRAFSPLSPNTIYSRLF